MKHLVLLVVIGAVVLACTISPAQPTIPFKVIRTVAHTQGYGSGLAWENDTLWVGAAFGNVLEKYDPYDGTRIKTITAPNTKVRDLTFDGMVFLAYEVRGRAAETGVFGPWICECTVLSYPDPGCLTPATFDLEQIAFESAGGLDRTLTGLKVRVLLLDMCPIRCDEFNDGYPHTVGALIDRIRVVAEMGGTPVEESPLVHVTRLHAAYPNPFNPRTEIRFELAEAGETMLSVFDVGGRRVRTLVEGHLRQGLHVETWDGADDHGRVLSSGVYFLRLETRTELASRKIVLVQ